MILVSQKKKAKSPSRSTKYRYKDLVWLTFVLIIFLALPVLTISPAIALLRQNIGVPEVDLPTLSHASSGVIIFDRSDHYLCTLHQEQDCQPVPLSKVSINMRNALLSAEDRHFYSHCGIDPNGVVRAFKRNYEAGYNVEGGSTVTQQLVRNLFLDKDDKSMKRKIKEAYLAWDVDHKYSKAKILETYLNVIYFGGGVHGIERAAQHYFDKHASDLSIPESAFLAGLIKAPSVLGAPENRKLAIARERVVVKKMAEYGFISETVKLKQITTNLVFKSGGLMIPYPYYTAYVMQDLKRKLGDDLWKQGWKVYTNLDVPTQELAEAALNKGIAAAPRGIDQGALVTMSVKDGAVLALVGGVGKYGNDPWNRALFPHTAGSSFKPFVYLAALMDGIIQPDTIIDDDQITVDTDNNSSTYSPKNFDGKFMGWIPARTALALSRNVCSARLGLKVGINRVIEIAHSAGIKAQLDAYPSIALGSCAVSPLDMTTAYATLARGGTYMEAQVLRRIQSDDGKTNLLVASTPSTNLPAEAVAQLVDLMEDVVRYGTGTQAKLPGIAVAGKTGTADSGKDIWFVGFTPDTVTAVWGGNDKNKPVNGKKVTGGTVMARIWHDYMMSFYKVHGLPSNIAFAPPDTRLLEKLTPYGQATGSNGDLADLGLFALPAEFDSDSLASGIARASNLSALAAFKENEQRILAQNVLPNPEKGLYNNGNASLLMNESIAVKAVSDENESIKVY